MVDSSSSASSPQFLTKHWGGFKEFWGERFSFLDHYSKFIKCDKPLPSWSNADVEAFIAFDPIHGCAVLFNFIGGGWSLVYVLFLDERVSFSLLFEDITGSVIGAVSTAGITWKYSMSLHGFGLAFLAGGVFSWTLGQEIANHSLQLYRFNTLAA